MSQLESSDISKLKINELKNILRKNNLPVSGNKPVLIKRVKDLVKPQKPLQFRRPSKHNVESWVPTNDKDYMNYIKTEFHDYKLKPLDQSIDPCKQKQKISLFDHQKFLKEYFKKLNQVDKRESNRGVFLYHSVGSGKTKSAVIMAEAARHYHENGKIMLRKVIGLIPASLRNSPWIQELIRKHPEHNSEVLLARIGYFFLHYNNTTTFKQQLKSLIDKDSKNPFDNAIVIVDEVHNILNSLPSATDSVRTQIYNWMMTSKNTKFIFLSGTPISNTPYELAYAVNILRGEPVFDVNNEDSKDQFMNKFFRNDHMINKQLLMRNIQGLFSYFIGADPRAFAKKQLHNIQSKMSSYQWDMQNIIYKREHDNNSDKPVGVARSDIESQIKTLYRARALNARGALRDVLGIRSGGSDDQVKGSFKVFSRMNSNFSYPKDILKKYSYEHFPEILNPKHFNKAIKEMDLINDLPILSQKITDIMKNIKKSQGPVIVFSNFEGPYGIRLFAKILEAHGIQSLDTTISDIKKLNKQTRYTIWSGATGQEDRKNILKIFNDDKNKLGEYVQIICITTAGKEGISLRGIRQIHIMEPWWNMNRPLQVIGRGVRICSHAHLPPASRIVDIYNYISVPSQNTKYIYPAIDITVMKNALAKQKKDNEFLKLIRESSLDCYINQSQSKVENCIDLHNYKSKNVYSKSIHQDKDDFADDIRVKKIEYNGKKYLIRGNLVYKYLTSSELNTGIIHKNIGIADIDISGKIVKITFTDENVYETITKNGRKFLMKNNELYQYLSPQDLRNGFKPVKL